MSLRMSLTPSGKLRKMENQSIGSHLSDDSRVKISAITDAGYNPAMSVPDNEPSYYDLLKRQQLDRGLGVEESPRDVTEDTEDMTDYLFNYYVDSFGYIPRILRGVKSDFVETNINNDGSSRITVKLPAKYWGSDKIISENDVKKMIHTIRDKFGYSFISSKIKGDEISMEFTSSNDDRQDREPREVGVNEDVAGLYKIYGKQPPGSDSKNRKKASKEYKIDINSLREAISNINKVSATVDNKKDS